MDNFCFLKKVSDHGSLKNWEKIKSHQSNCVFACRNNFDETDIIVRNFDESNALKPQFVVPEFAPVARALKFRTGCAVDWIPIT